MKGPLIALDALPDGLPQGVHLEDGRALILLRRGDQVLAYLNRCPHRGLELDWVPNQFLDPSGRYLQCATHGALFHPEDGRCIQGPCAGRGLERVPVEVEGDQVWLKE